MCLRLREQCSRSEITSVYRVAHVLLSRFVAGNVGVNTLASCVIHRKSTCVCLRFSVAAFTRKRRDARFDLWPAASTHRSTFCGLRGAFEQSLCFRSTGNVWTPAYSRPCYRRQNVRVEHALLEQLTLFPNATIVLEDVDTHRSSNFRRCVKTQTKRRQSHVNTDIVPESENAET